MYYPMYEVLYKVITKRGWMWQNEYFPFESLAQEFAAIRPSSIVRKVKAL